MQFPSKPDSICLFCGCPTDNRNAEHVIPRWLQKRHKLTNKPMVLPNGTLIKYRNIKVPACGKHNAAFSKIENRLASGSASPQDIYLLAFKLHAGLTLLHSRLSNNQSRAEEGYMQTWGLTGDALLERTMLHLICFHDVVRVWEMGGTFSPSPLGSVFELPSKREGFNFVHSPHGFVGLNIDERHYATCLFDGGAARRAGYASSWSDPNAKIEFVLNGRIKSLSFPPADFPLREKLWLAWVADATLRQGRPILSDVGPSHVTLLSPIWRKPGPLDLNSFSAFLVSFGYHLSIQGGSIIIVDNVTIRKEVNSTGSNVK